jgi:hypothetical protein
MTSLSDLLLAVLDINRPLQTQDEESTPDYETVITRNKDAINALFEQGEVLSDEDRTERVCKASKLLFAPAVIDQKDPEYKSYEQKNW